MSFELKFMFILSVLGFRKYVWGNEASVARRTKGRNQNEDHDDERDESCHERDVKGDVECKCVWDDWEILLTLRERDFGMVSRVPFQPEKSADAKERANIAHHHRAKPSKMQSQSQALVPKSISRNSCWELWFTKWRRDEKPQKNRKKRDLEADCLRILRFLFSQPHRNRSFDLFDCDFDPFSADLMSLELASFLLSAVSPMIDVSDTSS